MAKGESIEHLQMPGRLGKPDMTFGDDPRADARLVAVMATMELAPGVAKPAADADYATALAYCAESEAAGDVTHPLLWEAMPAFDDVESSTETIQGVDGNDITLFIDRPRHQNGPLPGMVHTHGGGMVLMRAADPGFVRWRRSAAQLGMVVIGVEFRNGGGSLGNHPFPAGLNDCAAATRWVIDRKADLNLASLIISGESGGGNLSIATTLKAHREGWSDGIDGVYAMCPYISGAYANPPNDLISLVENNGYMLDCAEMTVLARVYDPTGEHATDPLAWPMHATVEELAGLPPHVISVNELDPLRDEGLQFYRKLTAAGVPGTARTVHGTPHAGDIMFPDVTPEVTAQTLASLYQFASTVGG